MYLNKITDPADDRVVTWRTLAAIATDVLRITAYKLRGGISDDLTDGHDDNDGEGEANVDEVDRDCGEDGAVYLEQLDECANTLQQVTSQDDTIRGVDSTCSRPLAIWTTPPQETVNIEATGLTCTMTDATWP